MKRRKRSQAVVERDEELLELIEPIKADHPAWGYRRVWAYLRYRRGVVVGNNGIYRIMKEYRLLAPSLRKLRAKRGSMGCQPTSINFMAACRVLGIDQIFTSFNNPKGNADTERFFRTLKEDLIWINEWSSIDQLQQLLEAWTDQYNKDCPHSEISYRTPQQFED